MIGVFPVWLWVFIACMALVVAFVPGVILLDRWLDRRDEKSLASDDEATVALFERMWHLRHPGWLATRLRLQLAALHTLTAAAQLPHHQLPVSPAASPSTPAGEAPGPVSAPPGPGARQYPWEQVLPPVPHEHDPAAWPVVGDHVPSTGRTWYDDDTGSFAAFVEAGVE